MAILEVIIAALVKRVLERAPSEQQIPRLSQESLSLHLSMVANWSRRVEFVGFPEAHDTDRDTVALVAALPRRFRGVRSSIQQSSEKELLLSKEHLVLLGDPGAGKTTTLKRLARILLGDPLDERDTAEYPIFVRLRDLSSEVLFEEAIARAFGIPVTRQVVKSTVVERDDRGREYSRTIEVVQVMSGVQPAIDVFARIANNTACLFLFDGLDEVRTDLRDRTESAIRDLAQRCETARILLTCRSGDYTRAIDGFDALELCPLEQSQISQIIAMWCSAPREFTHALSKLPFSDLATRPLFLCQLIVLFENSGFLPEQPAHVYRRVIVLALEEWDRNKRVDRRSKYAGFNPARKLEFLAALAFHLTYTLNQKYFTPESFSSAYEATRQGFGLPQGESAQVFRELESHTGIIVEAGFERYEFSHLSLQEFLAADYVLRGRISKDTTAHMSINPEPVAISVAMASKPSQQLAAVLLSPWHGGRFAEFRLSSFFARAYQEGLILEDDIALGFTALAIISANHKGEFVQKFLSEPVVERAIVEALLEAYHAKATGDTVQLGLRWDRRASYDLAVPQHATVPAWQLEQIMDRHAIRLAPVDDYLAEDGVACEQFAFVSHAKERAAP